MRWIPYSLLVSSSLLFAGPSALAQPANDGCANAIAIACGETLSGSTLDATSDVAPDCGTTVDAAGVWYSFEGVLAQVTASTCSNFSYDTRINVYRGSCDEFTCVAGNDDFCDLGSSATFVAEEGITYFILVNGFEGATGDFDLSITCAPVDEDDCLGALPIACGETLTGSTTDALTDAAPDCGTSVSAAGIWYTFTGIDGQMTLTTCGPGTDYDSKLNVYTGSCSDLECVAGNDDIAEGVPCSSVTFNTTAGTTYYALVQGYDGATGNYGISLTCQTCGTPQNVNTTTLDVSALLYWESANTGAQFTVEFGPAGFTLGTGTVITGTNGVDGPPVELTGLTADTQYDVYVTDDCGSGDVSLPAGPVTFTTLAVPPAANASCATPTPLVCGSTVEGNTELGLYTPGPACGSANVSTKGLWYSFTGTDEEITLSTCDATDYDSKISVFTGTCEELVCAGGNDDAVGCGGNSSSVTFLSTNGTAYLVLVHGYDQDQGQFTITMTCATGCTPVENDQCSGATELSLQPLGGCEASTGNNLCAYAPAVANPPCDPWAPIIDVWYSFNTGWGTTTSLTLTQVTATNLSLALYTDCEEPAYIQCWNGVNGATDITALVQPNTSYLVRVWNGGATQAGTFAICVEGDFNTGVDQAAKPDAMLLYPNPASNVVHVRGVGDVRRVAVIDLQGRVAFTSSTLGRDELALSINSLSPGSYLLRALDADGRVLGRFVKE
ncbi:MAG: T9SS type A sorting domain-containing protein [Flavobacteriales bacterium]